MKGVDLHVELAEKKEKCGGAIHHNGQSVVERARVVCVSVIERARERETERE